MSGWPPNEPAEAPGADAVHAVVLQHFDQDNGTVEPLRTKDLTFREIRDSLWLAARLRPRSRPTTQPPPPDPDTEPVAPAEPPPPIDTPTGKAGAGQGEEWVPGPLTMAPGAPAPMV